MICGILGHFANFFSAVDKYSLRNGENFLQPILMQFPKKRIIFSESFCKFLKFMSLFEHFREKITLLASLFPKLHTVKDLLRQMSRKLRFRTPFDSQHVKGSQTLDLKNVPLSNVWNPRALCQYVDYQ